MAGVDSFIQPRPCAKCPWLIKYFGPGDFLRPGRRLEILRGIEHGGEFPCHETTEFDDDTGEAIHTNSERCCAGLAVLLLREERSSQMMRIAERIGAFNPEKFLARNEEVVTWTWDQAMSGM